MMQKQQPREAPTQPPPNAADCDCRARGNLRSSTALALALSLSATTLGGAMLPDPQRRSELTRREALERDPCVCDGPGCPPPQEGTGCRGDAVLHGAYADGEPNGLVVQAELSHADGHGERKAALEMINRHSPGSTRRLTLGADKGYDRADFIAALRRMVVTPNVAQKARHSAIDGRTTQHPGYGLSQRSRKKIEEPFGWAKSVGGMAQTLHRGLDSVRKFTMTMAACNLARLPKYASPRIPRR
jgi:hypothetical protein